MSLEYLALDKLDLKLDLISLHAVIYVALNLLFKLITNTNYQDVRMCLCDQGGVYIDNSVDAVGQLSRMENNFTMRYCSLMEMK